MIASMASPLTNMTAQTRRVRLRSLKRKRMRRMIGKISSQDYQVGVFPKYSLTQQIIYNCNKSCGGSPTVDILYSPLVVNVNVQAVRPVIPGGGCTGPNETGSCGEAGFLRFLDFQPNHRQVAQGTALVAHRLKGHG